MCFISIKSLFCNKRAQVEHIMRKLFFLLRNYLDCVNLTLQRGDLFVMQLTQYRYYKENFLLNCKENYRSVVIFIQKGSRNYSQKKK